MERLEGMCRHARLQLPDSMLILRTENLPAMNGLCMAVHHQIAGFTHVSQLTMAIRAVGSRVDWYILDLEMMLNSVCDKSKVLKDDVHPKNEYMQQVFHVIKNMHRAKRYGG